jgi:hypothetical protein
MDSGRGQVSWPGQQNRAAVATIKEALHGQWPWPTAGKVSKIQSSNDHYKGDFTWTMAMAISWPSQQNRAAVATIKEALHGQWPWPSAGQVSIRE